MSREIRRLGLGLGLAAVGIFALGCLGPGTERQPQLYVLDTVVPATESEKLDLAVGVGPVSIPERLDRPQILTRSSDHEVEIAEFDRWAEPLEKSFALVLAENLSRALPTDRVSLYPWRRTTPVDLQVTVVVTRFEREPDGAVTLAARWRLIGPAGLEVRPQRSSTYREAAGDSTEELVAAMSRAIGAFAQEVAVALRSSEP
jgi:uncharacterized lipoprotein YmbA